MINEVVFTPPEVEALGDLAEGVYSSTGWILDESIPEAAAFSEAYEAEFGAPPDWWSELGYTAAKQLMAAIEAAGTTDYAAVAPLMNDEHGFTTPARQAAALQRKGTAARRRLDHHPGTGRCPLACGRRSAGRLANVSLACGAPVRARPTGPGRRTLLTRGGREWSEPTYRSRSRSSRPSAPAAGWNDVVRAGNTLWVTGQLGWDKTTGVLADTLEGQVEQALENLKRALGRAGAALSDVVLTRVYLVDHDHYHRYEPIYDRYFPTNQPARVSVVVAELIHHASVRHRGCGGDRRRWLIITRPSRGVGPRPRPTEYGPKEENT